MTDAFTTANIAGTTGLSGPKLSPAAEDWFLTRGIGRETLERLPVASGITYFPGLKRKSEGIFFKFVEGWKARSFPEKDFVSSKGWKPSFWNLDAVLDLLDQMPDVPVFITEGEIDAISLIEAGIPENQVLSVPNGASGSVEEDRGLPYLLDALQIGLNRAKKIIWCGDSDEPGLALRATMAHQFGVAKYWYVEWPDGYKDANEVLLAFDPLYLRNLVLSGAKPWPADGLYRMSELPEPCRLVTWEPDIDCLKGRVWLAPTTVSVVTGQPNHGKSTVWGQIWFEIVRKYGLVACVASFETRPKPYMRRQMRTLLNGGVAEYKLTEDQVRRADEWIEAHYLFVNHPDQRPSLDWFLDQAEIAVVRHGARIIQIDPWNRLESARARDETETEHIARCLRALAVFAVDMNCHVQVVAHPAKMDKNRKGLAPELEDISGSKHWDNMPDQGFVIHRPKLYEEGNRRTEAQFIYRKSRFNDELGFPQSLWINYDAETKTYVGLSLPPPAE